MVETKVLFGDEKSLFENIHDTLVVCPESMTLFYEKMIGMLFTNTVKSIDKILSESESLIKERNDVANPAVAEIYNWIKKKSGSFFKKEIPRIGFRTSKKILSVIRQFQENGYDEDDVRYLALKAKGKNDVLSKKLTDIADLYPFAGISYSIIPANILMHIQMLYPQENVIFVGFSRMTQRMKDLILYFKGMRKKVSVYVQIPETPGSEWRKERGIVSGLSGSPCFGKVTSIQSSVNSLADSLVNKKSATPLPLVSTYVAPEYEERLYVAQQLVAWHKDGRKWSDMAIILPDEATDDPLLRNILKMNGIPHCADVKEPLILTYGAAFMLRALEAIASGYATEEMLKYLGLIKEHGAFISYIKARPIKWDKTITKGFGVSEEEAQEFNEQRIRIYEPLAFFADRLKKAKDAKEQAQIVFEFLISSGVYAELKKENDELIRKGFSDEAEMARQSWKAILKILDELAHVSFKMSLQEIACYVKCAVDDTKLQSVPQRADAVIINTAKHIPPGLFKVTVLLGNNEKEAEANKTVLSSAERQWIDANSPGDVIGEMSEASKITGNDISYLGRAAAIHSEECLVTCSIEFPANSLFKHAVAVSNSNKGGHSCDDILPFSKSVTVEMIADKLRELTNNNNGDLSDSETSSNSVLWKKAFEFCITGGGGEVIYKILDSIHAKVSNLPLAKNFSLELYKEKKSTSVSELETYAQCPYKHYIQYGLCIKPQKHFGFLADTEGTFFHEALRLYVEEATKYKNFPYFDKKTVYKVFNEATKELVSNLLSNGPFNGLLGHLEALDSIESCRTVALAITYWCAKDGYRPIATEEAFGRIGSANPGLSFNVDGQVIELAGSIDRVDIYKDPVTNLLFGRVVDYKRSNNELNLEAVKGGFSLQLPLYLRQMTISHPSLKMGGALYQQVKNPVVDGDSEDEAALKAIESLKTTGVVSDVISGNTKATRVSQQQLEDMVNDAVDKAGEHLSNMKSGLIQINPIIVGSKNPCTYCPYATLCGIDPRLPGGLPHDINGKEIVD